VTATTSHGFQKAYSEPFGTGMILGFGEALLRLAERKARNPALRAGKSFKECIGLPSSELSF
jgi:hypothetical protein